MATPSTQEALSVLLVLLNGHDSLGRSLRQKFVEISTKSEDFYAQAVQENTHVIFTPIYAQSQAPSDTTPLLRITMSLCWKISLAC